MKTKEFPELKVNETVVLAIENETVTLVVKPAEGMDLPENAYLGVPCFGCYFNQAYCTKIDLDLQEAAKLGTCNSYLRDDNQDIIYTLMSK